MAGYRVYKFGQFRLVPRDRMLYSTSGLKARIVGKPLDLLLYLLDNAKTEIDTDFLCTGQFSDGVRLTNESLNKHFGKLYALIDPDRQQPNYIRRDDRSTWFLEKPLITEEEEQPNPEVKLNSFPISVVPALPSNYVPRPLELRALRDALFATAPGPGIALTAYAGMGGIGKTILAQALCRDDVVQKAFPEGIAWISLGKEFSNDDLIRKMREMGKGIGADLSHCESVFDCGNEFKRALRDKLALVVVDDVWSARDLEPFLADARRARLVFTTRNRTIAADVGAAEHTATLLDEKQSLLFLAKWSGIPAQSLPRESLELIEECGRLPLALAMTGAMLRGKPKEMWRQLLDRLRSADLNKIRAIFPNYPHSNLLRSIQVSVDALDDDTRRCYLALGVLLEDMPAGSAIQQLLWNQTRGEALETSESLISLSLAERYLDGLKLHDLHLDYVRAQCAWRDSLGLIHEALRLSTHVIHEDPRQFSSQLFGRLSRFSADPGILSFLEYLRRACPFPWIRPQNGGLTHLGGCLRWILPLSESFRNKLMITADGHRCVAGTRSSLVIVDLDHGRVERKIDVIPESNHESLWTFAVDAKATRAICLLTDGHVTMWDLERGVNIGNLSDEGRTFHIAISEDGRRVVSASSDGVLTLREISSSAALWKASVVGRQVRDLSVGGDNSRAVLVLGTNTLVVWDLVSGREHMKLDVPTKYGTKARLSQNGRRVCAVFEETILVWDLDSGQQRSWTDPDGFEDLALDTEGRWCLTSSSNVPFLKLWDTTSGGDVLTLRGHTLLVDSLTLSADGHLAVSVGGDATLRVWHLDLDMKWGDDRDHKGPVGAVAGARDGKTAVSASHDGTLTDFTAGRRLRQLKGHEDWIRGLAVTGDGRVVSASNRQLIVWEMGSGLRLRTHNRDVNLFHASEVFGLALTPDDRFAVLAEDWETAEVLDIETGKSVRRLTPAQIDDGSRPCIRSVAVTSDGTRAISVSQEGNAWVWDLTTGVLLRTIRPRVRGGLLAVACIGRSRAIVASTEMVILDLETGRELRTIDGHADPVWGLAVSPDGKRAASASFDRTLRVWDLESGRLLCTFTNDGTLRSCAFLTATKIIAGDAGGKVHFLELIGT